MHSFLTTYRQNCLDSVVQSVKYLNEISLDIAIKAKSHYCNKSHNFQYVGLNQT